MGFRRVVRAIGSGSFKECYGGISVAAHTNGSVVLMQASQAVAGCAQLVAQRFSGLLMAMCLVIACLLASAGTARAQGAADAANGGWLIGDCYGVNCGPPSTLYSGPQ